MDKPSLPVHNPAGLIRLTGEMVPEPQAIALLFMLACSLAVNVWLGTALRDSREKADNCRAPAVRLKAIRHRLTKMGQSVMEMQDLSPGDTFKTDANEQWTVMVEALTEAR